MNSAPGSPDEVETPVVEPQAAVVENEPVIESAADHEPTAGNEPRNEGKHDPTLETGDAANLIDDHKSPDKTKPP